MVPGFSRAYVGKCQITRNDPRLCQVIDFCILRTFYSIGDSLFSLRLPGRRISTGSGLLSHQLSSRESTGQTNEAALRFFCFFVLLYVCPNCLGGHGGPEYVSGQSGAIWGQSEPSRVVRRASRAYVEKCQIARNDPRLCQVIYFCILRTFYSVGDSVFSLRLPGRRILTGS